MHKRSSGSIFFRAPRILIWFAVLFVFDLLYVPIVDDLMSGGGRNSMSLAVLTGPLLGQCFVAAILGGLYGATWIDGFRAVVFAVLIGFSMFACGIALEEGLSDDDTFWATYFSLPGITFAVLTPLLLMRHFANWRIVDPNRVYAKQPADLGGIFISIAALALIVGALRIPQQVFSTPAPTFWMMSMSIGIVTMLVSSVVTLPLAAFVLNSNQPRARIVATVVCAIVAYAVFCLCMMVIGIATGDAVPGELLTMAGASTVTATLVVFAGMWAIRADGFRLRTNSNGLATWTLPETDQEKQFAQTSLSQNRYRTVVQLVGCFLIMAAINAYVTVTHSAEAQYERGIEKVRETVARVGASLTEYEDRTFEIRWGGRDSEKFAFEGVFVDLYNAVHRNKMTDKLVGMDFSGVKGNLFYWGPQNYAPNLRSLDISYTTANEANLAQLQVLPLEHFAAKGLLLGQVDWSFLNPGTLRSLVLDGATVDTNRLAQHLAKCNKLERLELNGIEIDSPFLDVISQMPPVQLERLGIAGADVDDDDVAQLRDHEFSELNLSRTKVTDACVESLLFCMRNGARDLKLSSTALTDKGASQLGAIQVSRLLDLSETDVTGDTFRDWERFPVELRLSKTMVGDELVNSLLEAPAIASIHEEKGMKLDLSHTRITDATLVPLSRSLPVVCSVDVSHTPVTFKGLADLAKQAKGSQLGWYIEKGKFTDQELNSLRTLGISVTQKK